MRKKLQRIGGGLALALAVLIAYLWWGPGPAHMIQKAVPAAMIASAGRMTSRMRARFMRLRSG